MIYNMLVVMSSKKKLLQKRITLAKYTIVNNNPSLTPTA